jgi:hypothetical protein
MMTVLTALAPMTATTALTTLSALALIIALPPRSPLLASGVDEGTFDIGHA